MVDALDLGSSGRITVEVQILSTATHMGLIWARQRKETKYRDRRLGNLLNKAYKN